MSGVKERAEYKYRRATAADLVRIWDKSIASNADDSRYPMWKELYIRYNESGMAQTYVVLCNGDPVGEGTLLFSPDCRAVRGRLFLSDGKSLANVNALRIEKAHEGQGHISRLMRLAEQDAAERGITALTIGVEARETRNLAIYLHLGYTRFVASEIEDGELVLYYEKKLKGEQA
ncbi:MAG: GNAT family N-acetyltransferase [Clostridia bacterium]|nr:GNAT family N-acetyltransferase [Clostridia bacterium]